MTTNIPIYVDPDAGGTADGGSWTDAYTSLQSALAAESSTPNQLTSANLVTNDEIADFRLRTSGGSVDAGLLADVSGFTTDWRRKVRITVEEGYRHNGLSKENTGLATYQIKPASGGYVLRLQDDNVAVTGIELTQGAGSTVLNLQAVTNAVFDDCLIDTLDTTGTTNPIVACSVAGTVARFRNCLVISDSQRPLDSRTSGGQITFEHCGFYGDSPIGILATEETTFFNCWSMGYAAGACWFNDTPQGEINASSDDSAGTAFDDKGFPFIVADECFRVVAIDPATADFRHKEGSPLINLGRDINVVGDVAGRNRPGDFSDIGPFSSGVPKYIERDPIVFKQTRTKQPPAGTKIDWGNPLTRDMLFFGASLDGQAPRNHVDGLQSAQLSAGGVVAPNEKGHVVDGPLDTLNVGFDWTDSGGVLYPALHDKIIATDQFTVLTIAKNRKTAIAATGGEDPAGWAGSGSDVFSLGWGQGETFITTIGGIASTFAVGSGLGAGSPDEANVWNALGGYYDGANVYARINSRIASGAALTGNIVHSSLSGNVPYMGNLTGGGDSTWDGWVSCFIMWTRVLSDAEWASMSANPWQIFAPELNFIYPEYAKPKFVSVDVPWTKQPPAGTKIDWSNPLTKGLHFAFNAAERAAINKTNNEFATAHEGAFIHSNNMIGWNIDTTTPVVLQWEFATSSSYSSLIENALANEEHSAFVLFSRPSDSGSTEILYDLHYNNNQRFELSIAINENITSYSFNTSVQGGNYPAADFGTVSSLASTFTQLEHKIYYNGALKTEEADNPVVPALSVYNRLVIGSASTTFEGPIYAVYAWSRKLSQPEMESFSANPWQIFEPQKLHAPIGELNHEFMKVQVPWTEQPPIGTKLDLSHPLLQQPAFFMNAMDGLAGTTDPFHDRRLAFRSTEFSTGDDSAYFGTLGQHRGWVQPDASSTRLSYGEVSSGLEGEDKVTIVWVGDLSEDQGPDGRILVSKSTGGGSTGRQFSLDRNQNNSMGAIIADGTNILNSQTPSGLGGAVGVTPTGQVDTVGLTWDGTTLDIWVGGVSKDPVTGVMTGGLQTAATRDLALSDYLGESADHIELDCFAFAVKRVWSSAEWASFHDNPWQIFEPRTVLVPKDTVLPDIAVVETSW